MNILCRFGIHKKRTIQEIRIEGISQPYICARGPIKEIEQVYLNGISQIFNKENVLKCIRCEKIFWRWIPPPEHVNCQCSIQE